MTFKNLAENFKIPDINLSTPIVILGKTFTAHSILQEDDGDLIYICDKELDASYQKSEIVNFIVQEEIATWLEKHMCEDQAIFNLFIQEFKNPMQENSLKSLLTDWFYQINPILEQLYYSEEYFNDNGLFR